MLQFTLRDLVTFLMLISLLITDKSIQSEDALTGRINHSSSKLVKKKSDALMIISLSIQVKRDKADSLVKIFQFVFVSYLQWRNGLCTQNTDDMLSANLTVFIFPSRSCQLSRIIQSLEVLMCKLLSKEYG